MNELEILRKLAVKAAGESVPEIDVSRGVLARITVRRVPGNRVLATCALASAAVAAALCVMAVYSWMTLPTPLGDLMNAMSPVVL